MEPKTTRRWKLGGYAPGGYTCKCLMCGDQFTGDKRAISCLPCAADRAEASRAVPVATQEQMAAVEAPLERELREVLSPYMDDAAKGLFTAESSAYRAARMVAGMLKPGNYLNRALEALTPSAGMGDRSQLLENIAALARELVSPAGMVNRGVDRGLVVVEKADKSDPHYRLCTALDALALTRRRVER